MTQPITLDILLSDEVCRLLDSFASTMKVQVVFYSANGQVLKRGRSFGNSRYCSLMQEKFFGIDRCIALDNEMQKQSLKSDRAVLYKCHAGLYELVAPVKIFGEAAGFVMFGQFRIGQDMPNFTSDKKIFKAFSELPCFDEEAAASLEEMINMLIRYIVDKELISYPGSMRYLRLKRFIEEHLTEKITLQKAASFLNMSVSSLTHFLRGNHRTSFKEMVIEQRISQAEKLLRGNASLTISEAAAEVGYDDPHYFSRLYRQVRKQTARQFLSSIRRGHIKTKQPRSRSSR